MTERKFYSNPNSVKPALPSRELWRLETGAGRLIVFETMEEVYFEARTPPYHDGHEILPILRVICESNTMVQVGPLRRVTVVLEGLSEGGTVLETRELIICEVRQSDWVVDRASTLIATQIGCGLMSAFHPNRTQAAPRAA